MWYLPVSDSRTFVRIVRRPSDCLCDVIFACIWPSVSRPSDCLCDVIFACIWPSVSRPSDCLCDVIFACIWPSVSRPSDCLCDVIFACIWPSVSRPSDCLCDVIFACIKLSDFCQLADHQIDYVMWYLPVSDSRTFVRIFRSPSDWLCDVIFACIWPSVNRPSDWLCDVILASIRPSDCCQLADHQIDHVILAGIRPSDLPLFVLQVFQAVQFLHELGSLQHFTNEFLKSYVVVNPQWIVDVMACVVSVKDSHIQVHVHKHKHTHTCKHTHTNTNTHSHTHTHTPYVPVLLIIPCIQDGRLHHDHIAEVWKDYPDNLHS